jgi:hypothetical protein
METTPERQHIDGFCTLTRKSVALNKQHTRAQLIFDVESKHDRVYDILRKVANGLNAVTFVCVSPTRHQLELAIVLASGTLFPEDKIIIFISEFAKAVQHEVRGTSRADVLWKQAAHL